MTCRCTGKSSVSIGAACFYNPPYTVSDNKNKSLPSQRKFLPILTFKAAKLTTRPRDFL